jgi:ferredoxin-NADP reductase
MDNGNSSQTGGFKLNSTPMIVSACLIGAGSLIGIAGMIVGGTAMMAAARQWFRELEVPPSEVVKQKFGQTKAATAAGASAWKQHNAMQRANA